MFPFYSCLSSPLCSFVSLISKETYLATARFINHTILPSEHVLKVTIHVSVYLQGTCMSDFLFYISFVLCFCDNIISKNNKCTCLLKNKTNAHVSDFIGIKKMVCVGFQMKFDLMLLLCSSRPVCSSLCVREGSCSVTGT